MNFDEVRKAIRRSRYKVSCCTGSGPWVNVTKPEALRWVDQVEKYGFEGAKIEVSRRGEVSIGTKNLGEPLTKATA